MWNRPELAMPWVLRLVWVALPFVVGAGVDEAVAGSDRAWAVAAVAWGGWAVGLGSMAVPRPVTLTALRVVAPAAFVLAAWAAAIGETSPLAIAGLGATAAAAFLALDPRVGEAFVDAASYGDERRMLLRPPAPLLLGPLELAWLVTVGGVVAGPLLWAANGALAGVAGLVVGLPGAFVAARALHRLARRWAVFVPAGMVIHDELALSAPVLFSRAVVDRVGPAAVDTTALDLTGHATGLVLELSATEPVPLAVARPRGEPVDSAPTAVLFTPSRPGALLAEAGRRRLPVDAR